MSGAEPKILSEILRNTVEYSSPATWMLRDVEHFARIPVGDLKKLLDRNSYQPVVAAQHFGLPKILRHVVCPASSEYFCFTLSDDPSDVQAQFLPDPARSLPSSRKRFAETKDPKTGSNPVSRASIPLDEIQGLSATDRSVFALGVTRGRTRGNDSWAIFQFDLDPDVGLLPNAVPGVQPLEFPQELFEISELSFQVVENDAFNVCFYIGGPPSVGLFSSRFVPGLLARPRRIPVVFDGHDRSWPISIAPIPTKSTSDCAVLVITDQSRGGVYELRHQRDDNVRLTRLLQKGDNYPTFSCAAYLTYNTSDLEVAVEPANQSLACIVLASRDSQQLWTLGDFGTPRLLPLLGGGDTPTTTTEPISNLLKLKIGPVDSLCNLFNGAVLFGTRDHAGWGILLLPRMSSLSRGSVRATGGTFHGSKSYDS